MLRWMLRSTIATLVLATSLGFGSVPASAQDVPVPESVQLSVIARTMLFDRNFASRVGEELVIGVLYQPEYRASRRSKDAIVEASAAQDLSRLLGLPVRVVAVPAAGSGSRVVNALARADIDIAYVTPLRMFDLDILARVCRELRIVTASGVAEYMENGIVLGIGSRGGRPEIVVNMMLARDIGVDFDSQFLQLARVIR